MAADGICGTAVRAEPETELRQASTAEQLRCKAANVPMDRCQGIDVKLRTSQATGQRNRSRECRNETLDWEKSVGSDGQIKKIERMSKRVNGNY